VLLDVVTWLLSQRIIAVEDRLLLLRKLHESAVLYCNKLHLHNGIDGPINTFLLKMSKIRNIDVQEKEMLDLLMVYSIILKTNEVTHNNLYIPIYIYKLSFMN
jgi:hypothetical protein